MKTKKLVMLLLTVTTLSLLIAGCFNTNPVRDEQGTVKIQLTVPQSIQSEVSEQFINYEPALENITVEITKDGVLRTATATIIGETAEVIFTDVTTGSWNVEAKIFDSNQYPVYSASNTAMVGAGTITTVPLHFLLLPGDLEVYVTLPDDGTVTAGNVCVMDPANAVNNIVEPLLVNGTLGKATFTQITATTYPIYIELLDAQGALVAWGEKMVDVLPGRVSSVSAQLMTGGSIAIDFTWELPPTAPTGVNAVSDGYSVELNWNPNPENNIAGYMVYRSSVNDPSTMQYLTSSLIQETFWLDTNVYSGETYYYWVQAFNIYNYSSSLSSSVASTISQRQIAMIVDNSVTQEVAVMNLDGTGYQVLTNNGWNQRVTWSPDGSQLLFCSNFEGSYSLYVMNGDGSNLHRISDLTHQTYRGFWSPDSTQVLYSAVINGEVGENIYLANADGSNMVNLTNTVGIYRADPVWSPDGTKILFRSENLDSTGLDHELFVMDADGSHCMQLTFDNKNQYSHQWSPDGSKILVETDGDGVWENWELTVMDAVGMNEQVIATYFTADAYPVWSPDGTQIAYRADHDHNYNWDLFVVNADGSGHKVVYDGSAYVTTPQWVDSDTLIFASNEGDDIWQIDTDGLGLMRLTNTVEVETSLSLSNL